MFAFLSLLLNYKYHKLHTFHWHYNALVSQEFVDIHIESHTQSVKS